MTLIDLGDFKIRFDPKEVRINIDGEIIDIGARREEEPPKLYNKDITQIISPSDDILKLSLALGQISEEDYENIIRIRGKKSNQK